MMIRLETYGGSEPPSSLVLAPAPSSSSVAPQRTGTKLILMLGYTVAGGGDIQQLHLKLLKKFTITFLILIKNIRRIYMNIY